MLVGLTLRDPEACTVPKPEIETLSAFSTAQRKVALWPAVIELGSTVKERTEAEGLGGGGAVGVGGGGVLATGVGFLHPTLNRESETASSAMLSFLRDMVFRKPPISGQFLLRNLYNKTLV